MSTNCNSHPLCQPYGSDETRRVGLRNGRLSRMKETLNDKGRRKKKLDWLHDRSREIFGRYTRIFLSTKYKRSWYIFFRGPFRLQVSRAVALILSGFSLYSRDIRRSLISCAIFCSLNSSTPREQYRVIRLAGFVQQRNPFAEHCAIFLYRFETKINSWIEATSHSKVHRCVCTYIYRFANTSFVKKVISSFNTIIRIKLSNFVMKILSNTYKRKEISLFIL